MANENATRSLDGTTVTITLSAENAQHAARGVRSLMHDALDRLPSDWENAGPYTAGQLESYAATAQTIADRYVPIMRQFEEQEVIDIGDAYYFAFCEAEQREPDRRRFDDIQPAPPVTGDATITWPVEGWERLVAELFKEDEPLIAAAIREQLEGAR